MKYFVKFSCGHECEVDLVGKYSERESKIKYYEESGICPECREKAKMEKIQKENECLPELVGSEKQISWASKIRMDYKERYQNSKIYKVYEKCDETQREELKKRYELMKNNPQFNGHPQLKEIKMVIKLFEETSASWWIDNRF
jgi:hypothetical protein